MNCCHFTLENNVTHLNLTIDIFCDLFYSSSFVTFITYVSIRVGADLFRLMFAQLSFKWFNLIIINNKRCSVVWWTHVLFDFVWLLLFFFSFPFHCDLVSHCSWATTAINSKFTNRLHVEWMNVEAHGMVTIPNDWYHIHILNSDHIIST